MFGYRMNQNGVKSTRYTRSIPLSILKKYWRTKDELGTEISDISAITADATYVLAGSGASSRWPYRLSRSTGCLVAWWSDRWRQSGTRSSWSGWREPTTGHTSSWGDRQIQRKCVFDVTSASQRPPQEMEFAARIVAVPGCIRVSLRTNAFN